MREINQMSILIVGSFDHWNALEKHYTEGLKPMVKHIDLFPFPNMVHEYFGNSLIRKIQYRYKWWIKLKLEELNSALIDRISNFKTDIVWIFKGIDILPETLLQIKRMGVKVVNYNPDHPFIRTFRSGGGQEIENALPFYDLVFCYSRDLMHEINCRYGGKVKTVYLPFGYSHKDIAMHPLPSSEMEVSEVQKICFIGNPDSELRYNTLAELIRRKLPIDIYGLGWKKYFNNKNDQTFIFPGVYEMEYWKTLQKYRVQLNIFRPHNINSHNMRSFEIPAIGGIQLAPSSIEHEELFTEGKEIFLFKNLDELENKARFLLDLSVKDALEIRKSSQARSTRSGYSYDDRAQIVYQAFKELCQNG